MFVRTSVDLNCDLGEGCGNDAELMGLIASANIACGYHAGDRDTMRQTVELALEHGVAVGAHPGYKDKENFGRTPMKLSAKEVNDLIVDQIGSLGNICKELGGELVHVKPHGALYNQAAKDKELAAAIAEAVVATDARLVFYGLSGSVMIGAAERAGLRTASEVFADRTYQNDGTLSPRSLENALIVDDEAAVSQVLDMVKYGRVRTLDAVMIPITADTICIHGDGEHAVRFASRVRAALESSCIEVERPFQ